MYFHIFCGFIWPLNAPEWTLLENLTSLKALVTCSTPDTPLLPSLPRNIAVYREDCLAKFDLQHHFPLS